MIKEGIRRKGEKLGGNQSNESSPRAGQSSRRSKRHTATLRLPRQEPSQEQQIAALRVPLDVSPPDPNREASQNGERLHRIIDIATYHPTKQPAVDTAPPNSPVPAPRITSDHVPQVCYVHRRCGSSRAMFVHVHPRGTQSGRG